jgi:hypothetical protein
MGGRGNILGFHGEVNTPIIKVACIWWVYIHTHGPSKFFIHLYYIYAYVPVGVLDQQSWPLLVPVSPRVSVCVNCAPRFELMKIYPNIQTRCFHLVLRGPWQGHVWVFEVFCSCRSTGPRTGSWQAVARTQEAKMEGLLRSVSKDKPESRSDQDICCGKKNPNRGTDRDSINVA